MRDPRFVWPHRLVEVTDVVIQNRYLLRPSEDATVVALAQGGASFAQGGALRADPGLCEATPEGLGTRNREEEE